MTLPSDIIYTPADLAQRLVDAVTLGQVASVVDFAVGDGALLKASQHRWPDATLYGFDIRSSAKLELLASCPTAKFMVSNFYDQHEVRANWSVVTCDLVDLIILNPPFSSRKAVSFSERDFEFRCSPSAWFLLNCVKFLRVGGQIVAIVPDSFLRSDRDDQARELLKSKCDFEVLWKERRAFKKHAVSVSIVRLTLRSKPQSAPAPNMQVIGGDSAEEVTIVRGKMAVHIARVLQDSGRTGIPYIHTTRLHSNFSYSDCWTIEGTATVEKSGILVPRVGRPSVDKCVYYDGKQPILLSDCVIWLSLGDEQKDRSLLSHIRKNFGEFSRIYGGSCAPYTTLKRLESYVLNL